MSKKDCFYDVVKLFEEYMHIKKGLNAEYEKTKQMGMYSQKFLNDIFMANDSRLREEHSRISAGIEKIREKFLRELDKEFDLVAVKPDAGLQALVTSGIAPTREEFTHLAKKYNGNYVNSRLLHDFADKNGYVLRNIITREEAEQAFDNFVHGVNSSMYTQSIPVYPDSGYAKIKADSYISKLENPALDCYEKPKTFEETIAQMATMENVDRKRADQEIDGEAFLRGFCGMGKKVNPEQPKSEEERTLEDEIEALSTEEKTDALHMAVYHGHAGEITQQEIDFIKSDDYKKLVEERNEQNSSITE